MAGISGQDSKNSTHGRKKDRKRSITGIRFGGQEVDYKKSVDKQKEQQAWQEEGQEAKHYRNQIGRTGSRLQEICGQAERTAPMAGRRTGSEILQESDWEDRK